MDLYKLDQAVSELRRYCQPLDYTLGEGKAKKNFLTLNLDHIARLNDERSSETLINSGELEKVLKEKDHRSRKALVWKNLFFNTSKRRTAKYESFFSGGNAPLFLHPELVPAVEDYVILSKELKQQWKAEAHARAARKAP